MSRRFRSGAVGAMMDEYERAAADLRRIAAAMTDDQFVQTLDAGTGDKHCRSVQTILSHVVSSGYGYANYLRKAFGIPFEQRQYTILPHNTCLEEFDRMCAYTAETLEGRWTYSDDQLMAIRIHSRWGPEYDMEQLLEHAIVHILRHRRQIERLLAEEPA